MPPLPQPGQVINGFRFNGGNPNDQRAWVKADDLAGADARSRLSLGLSQAVDAHKRMLEMEKAGNPLNRDWGAAMVGSLPKGIGDAAAKVIGGQDYQDYVTAQKAYEAAILPILSGANVTPSEAPRQQGAWAGQLGDSEQTIHAKERTRAMQLNGAARSMGLPPPFPDVDTYGITQGNQQQAAPPPQQQSGVPVYDITGKRIR